MKALLICQRDDPATGGAARVAVELAKRLPEEGVEAKCVFVYGEPGPFGEELGTAALHLGLSSGREGVTRCLSLRHRLRDEGAEILHHHDGLTWTHLLTRSLPRVVRIGHAHLSPPGKSAPFRSRLAHWVHHRTYDELVAVSEATRSDWVSARFPSARTHLVANGVDLERFRPPTQPEQTSLRREWGARDDQVVVGFVGRLDSQMKGCEEFLRSFTHLPEHFLGVVAGDGPDRKSLECLARDLGLSNRLRFLGLVDPALAGYGGFDLFAMTSSFEPFGLVLLEAAASGVPLVVLPSEGGALALAADLGARIVPDRLPASLAAAIKTMAAAKTPIQSRLAQVEAVRDRLEAYSWSHAAGAVAEIYRNAIRERDARGRSCEAPVN